MAGEYLRATFLLGEAAALAVINRFKIPPSIATPSVLTNGFSPERHRAANMDDPLLIMLIVVPI